MAKITKANERSGALKAILTKVGRMRSLRDPLAAMGENLSPPQIHALMWLKEDGAQPMSVIAQRLGCTAPTMTGVVDRLVRAGLCERLRDGADRRVVRIANTVKGARIAGRIDRAFFDHLSKFFEILGPADGDELLGILSRMLATIEGKQRTSATRKRS